MRCVLVVLALTGCAPRPTVAPAGVGGKAEKALAEATQLVQERQNCDRALWKAESARHLAVRARDSLIEREAYLAAGLAQQCRGHPAEAVTELVVYLDLGGAHPIARSQLIASCHAAFAPEGVPAPGPARETLRDSLAAEAERLDLNVVSRATDGSSPPSSGSLATTTTVTGPRYTAGGVQTAPVISSHGSSSGSGLGRAIQASRQRSRWVEASTRVVARLACLDEVQ